MTKSLKERFQAKLADPNLMHYAQRIHSDENDAMNIFEEFENEHPPENASEEDDPYCIAGVCCDNQYWIVASIHKEHALSMERLARKNGLIIKDSTHAPCELQITSLFVLEKNPGYIDTNPHQHRLQ